MPWNEPPTAAEMEAMFCVCWHKECPLYSPSAEEYCGAADEAEMIKADCPFYSDDEKRRSLESK